MKKMNSMPDAESMLKGNRFCGTYRYPVFEEEGKETPAMPEKTERERSRERIKRKKRRRRVILIKMTLFCILAVGVIAGSISIFARSETKGESRGENGLEDVSVIGGSEGQGRLSGEDTIPAWLFPDVEAIAEAAADTEPPVIEGVEELTVTAGGSVSYKKNITVTDNRDQEVTLTVDNSAVDLNQAGDYPITYIAEDAAGNVTEVSTVLHVKIPGVESATEELVNAKADEILAEITTDGMSQYEIIEAIFNWTHEQIAYVDGTPKTDWVQGAYRGLFERKGDCFVYASTSKCLLTRAGITNMDIEKIPAKTHHYWNLVDIGDGWYHFDATRRKDGTIIFYWTDEELISYSNSHNLSHNYDPSKYPEIQ